MEQFKLICKKIFCLPLHITIIIAVPSFALVIIVLAHGTENHTAIAYVSYLLSAYALIISITGADRIIRLIQSDGQRIFYSLRLVKKIRSNPLGAKLIDSDVFRSELGMHGSMAMNLIYAVTNGWTGIKNASSWSISMAVYYLLLSVMRGILVRYSHRKHSEKDAASEYRSYRIIGIILLLMNQALGAIVVYMAYKNEGAVYSGLMIYWMAAYTFYITILAVINVIKYRKRNSPVLSAGKVISLTASLVSMLSLETAMITQFGGERDVASGFRRMMVGISGGIVCVLVMGMAVYMIIRATKYLRSVKKEAMQYEQ